MLGVVVHIWEKETDMTSQPGLHSGTVSKEKPGVGRGVREVGEGRSMKHPLSVIASPGG